MGMADWAAAIGNFPTDYPRLTGWFSSTISVGVLLTALSSFWKRPIIKVELGAHSHGRVPLRLTNQQGETTETTAKYFRLRITNAGLTTIRDCSGQLLKVTRRVPGKEPDYFDSERGYTFGWAHYDKSEKRDILRRQSYDLDIATLAFSPKGRSQLVFGGLNRPMPTTLAAFLSSYSGKATYRYDLLISAEHARPRIVPVEMDFDPKRDRLKFIPFNTRCFGWRVLWWLHTRRSRRRQTP